MKNTALKSLLLASSLLTSAGFAHAADVTLTVESWRNDDLQIWQEKIIPAFEAKNPGIKIVFSPTAPTEYNASLNAKLDAGSAGDIITCRPFDASLELYNKKQLADLTSLPGMENFSPVAKAAWTTDDGQVDLLRADGFGHPRLHLQQGCLRQARHLPFRRRRTSSSQRSTRSRRTAPTSRWPWARRTSGKPQPWATRTSARTTGRVKTAALALIAGKQKLTDAQWVEPYKELAKWKPYLGDGFEAQTYPDSQNLFTLGRAAIYPAGSWEIALFNSQAQFKMGAFPPPVPKAGDHGLHLRSSGYRRRPEREEHASGGSQEVPELGGIPRIRRHLCQLAAGLLQPELHPGEDERSARSGIRFLARPVQVDRPLDLPDPGRAARRTWKTKPGLNRPT